MKCISVLSQNKFEEELKQSDFNMQMLFDQKAKEENENFGLVQMTESLEISEQGEEKSPEI